MRARNDQGNGLSLPGSLTLWALAAAGLLALLFIALSIYPPPPSFRG